jgi:hypothetical protein
MCTTGVPVQNSTPILKLIYVLLLLLVKSIFTSKFDKAYRKKYKHHHYQISIIVLTIKKNIFAFDTC